MFEGKVFQFFHAKGFQVIQFVVGYTVLHRLDIAPVDAHEKDVEQGGDDMEMFAQGQKTQEEEKGDLMDKIGQRMQSLQGRLRCID